MTFYELTNFDEATLGDIDWLDAKIPDAEK